MRPTTKPHGADVGSHRSDSIQLFKADPAASGLKGRLQIDLNIFQLLDALEDVSDLDLDEELLDQINLPTIATLADAAANALEQDRATALKTISDMMEPLNCFSGVLEHEEWFDEAARLKECWDGIDELLRATCPDTTREPWVDIPAAIRARQTEALA